jgi:putative phosphotransacetylase
MGENRDGLAAKVREAALRAIFRETGKRFVPVAVSNRHAHLCRRDIDALFGDGYELTRMRDLSQPGQYAAHETLSLIGPKGRIDGIRVLGPARKATQVEISVTDSFKLGIEPTVRMSGDTAGSPGGRLETASGGVVLNEGVIVAARHLHLSTAQAEEMKLSDGQIVSLQSGGERRLVLESVVVRTGCGYEMEAHIDTDEANAALLKNGDLLEAKIQKTHDEAVIWTKNGAVC